MNKSIEEKNRIFMINHDSPTLPCLFFYIALTFKRLFWGDGRPKNEMERHRPRSFVLLSNSWLLFQCRVQLIIKEETLWAHMIMSIRLLHK
jgi:hypothetical protein